MSSIGRKQNRNRKAVKGVKRTSSLAPIDPNMLTRQMRDVLTAIPDHPEAFEQFSELPLDQQINRIKLMQLAGGGQKGGAFKDVINGFIIRYITPAWETARDRASAGKDYVTDIAVNYMNQIQTLATQAGLSGANAQQNLQSILYGLAVLAAAWNLGLIQMIPGLAFYLMTILGSTVTTLAAVPTNPLVHDILMKIAVFYVAYRYRDIPLGIYGVFAGAVTPIFTAIYARGDQAFQEAFPDFGQNMAAGGAAQLRELKESLGRSVETVRNRLQAAADSTQPTINAVKGLRDAWRNYVNDSIQKLINGLAQAQTDMGAIRDYYTFLENLGQEAQRQGAAIPEETAEQIADLIVPIVPVEVTNDNINNLVAGAVVMGDVISDEMSNPENPISAEEAAALLLSLGKITNANGNANAANANAANAANISRNNLNAAGLGGGKAHRRRHRKTAKKSRKKKHTKKHKAHKRKTTKGKKGKKSKRHTKRRSYKGGAHDPVHL